MNSHKENIRECFSNQKQQASESLQALVHDFEPELERLKQGLAAIEDSHIMEFPQASLSFGR